MDEKLLFKGILIVSDMDKTLLTEDFEVPQRNIDAIERFISKGGHFSLATGRSAESAEKYLKKVPINSPCILTNGASIFDFRIHEILWNAELSDSIKTLLPNILERFPDIGMEIYKDEQIYIINKSRRTEQHIINEGIKFTECSIDDVTGSWQKILFADENSKLLKVQDYIKELGYKDCDFVFSNTIYYEALPHNASKGTALPRLASLTGIDMSMTVGIGDYYNDISLLKASGFGVTVMGAPKELLDEADFVTGPCENGAVADFIEHLENNPELLRL